jgi:predicted nucleic acid-binding Zn ribbon protein
VDAHVSGQVRRVKFEDEANAVAWISGKPVTACPLNSSTPFGMKLEANMAGSVLSKPAAQRYSASATASPPVNGGWVKSNWEQEWGCQGTGGRCFILSFKNGFLYFVRKLQRWLCS